MTHCRTSSFAVGSGVVFSARAIPAVATSFTAVSAIAITVPCKTKQDDNGDKESGNERGDKDKGKKLFEVIHGRKRAKRKHTVKE